MGPLGWISFDFASAVFSVMLAFSLTPFVDIVRSVSPTACSFGFAILVVFVAHIAGLHDTRLIKESEGVYSRVVSVVSIAMGLLLLELTIVHFAKIGRYIVGTSVFSCAWMMIAARVLTSHFAANFLQTIGILGDDEFCFRGARFVDSNSRQFNVVSRTFEANGQALADWAIECGVDELVFDSNSLNEGRDQELLACLDEGIKVSSYTDFVEDHYLQVPVEEIDASWLFSARLDLAHPYYHGIKRGIDFLAAMVGLILTLPLMAIAIVLIRFESRGPAIYSQIRTGRFGRPFRIYKLRTMVQNAESKGAQWASAGDTRITRWGRILRKTRVDELPQFWNVLRGDMSLVGPRPERPEFVELLQHEIPFYVQRHLVKPGLTGWAQINYPYGSSVEDSQNKLTFDLFYIKRASLQLDLQILLRTIGTMMKGSR